MERVLLREKILSISRGTAPSSPHARSHAKGFYSTQAKHDTWGSGRHTDGGQQSGWRRRCGRPMKTR
eukprot:5273072-Lingulodinium_polyedra.AAC.1